VEYRHGEKKVTFGTSAQFGKRDPTTGRRFKGTGMLPELKKRGEDGASGKKNEGNFATGEGERDSRTIPWERGGKRG